MMLKKYLAIFFLSLASMIMLTFTILPHHHHQAYICFTTSHCEDHDARHENHSHDEGPLSNHQSCTGNLLQARIGRLQNLEPDYQEGQVHHFILIPFLQPNILALLSLRADEIFRPQFLYREKLHPVCYISEFSGRAPPVLG